MPVVKTSKEELIRRCIPVINQQGYRNTSVADLARACGVHASHFYYYFASKEDLLHEVLKSIHLYFQHRVLVFAHDQSLPPRQRLERMAAAFERYFVGEGGQIMGNTTLEVAQFEPAFLPTLQAFFNEFTEAFFTLYLTQLPESQAKETAERAVQDVEGGLMMMRLHRNPRYLHDALRRSVEPLRPQPAEGSFS